METLTQLPFQVLFLIAVASMGLPVYQINRRNIGTMRVDAHLIKPSAWRSAFRAQIASWRAWLTRLAPIAAVLLLAIALTLPDQGDAFSGGVLLVGQVGFNVKALKQEKADLNAKLAKVKAEGWKLGAKAVRDRTPEEVARLTAIDTEIAALNDEITANAEEIARAQRYLADNTPVVEVGENRAEGEPWAPQAAADAPKHVKDELRHMALGRFALAVRAAGLGLGTDDRLMAAATGGGTQTDSNLGFAVPNEVAPGIEREMFEGGDILSRVDARTITGNSITYNMFDETSRADSSRGGGILGYWVDEGTAPTASNTKLAKMEMKLRKVGAFGVMTDEILQDAVALGGELETNFAAELIFQVENKIYRGNGSSAPQGFLNAACLVSVSKETNQAAASINTTNLSKMWARMPARSKANAVWMINVDCEPQLDELAQAIGTGGTAPRFVTYSESGVLRIKGRPVIHSEFAESVGTVGDIACVDWKKYRLIRKGGVEQASSMHVYFAQGEQAFRAFYRVDGQAAPRSALTPFKGSNTLSPFVVLATRA